MKPLEPKYIGKLTESDETTFRKVVNYDLAVLMRSINDLNDEVCKLTSKTSKKHTFLKLVGIIFVVKSAYDIYKLETKVSKLEEHIESIKKEDSEW